MNMQQRSALEGPCNIIEGFGEYYCSQQELETMAELRCGGHWSLNASFGSIQRPDFILAQTSLFRGL